MRSYLFKFTYGERDPVSRRSPIIEHGLYGVELTKEEFEALTADELRQIIRTYDRWGGLRVIHHVDDTMKAYTDHGLFCDHSSDDRGGPDGGYDVVETVQAESEQQAEKLAVYWRGYHERIHGATMVVYGNQVRLEFDWPGQRSRKARRLLHEAGFSGLYGGNWGRPRSDDAVAAARQVLEDIHALKGR
jgi:hypothetical protein